MRSIFLAAFALLPSPTSITPAQENPELGRIWTFENPPLAYLERKYGFEPDQEWLDSLRLGSLRLGGEDILSGFGSASFVSPRGLMLTSSRCVHDAIAWTRTKDLDLIKTGFLAATPDQEIRLRTRFDGWLSAAQLVRITNVTDEVNEGVAPIDNDARIRGKREANKKAILHAARQADPKLVPHVVGLYQGAVFRLYQYKVYDDVRLVCIPHLRIARFGGDADTFTYPRYSLDFAFLRAYEDGKSADTTKHHLGWKSGGAKENELVFVSGNPSVTKRLCTKAQLELERDVELPMRIEWLTNRLRVWTGEPGFDPENPSRHWAWLRTTILDLQDGLKAARAKLQGLGDAQSMARKTAAENAFKGRVMANEKLAAKYGDLWDRLAAVVEERRGHDVRVRFHTTGGMGNVNNAITMVRSCDPAETEETRKQAREEMEGWTRGGLPNYFGRAFAVDHFVRARSWLPEDDPYFSKVLCGRSGDEFLEAVIGSGNAGHHGGPTVRTLVYYEEQRDALLEGGWKAIQDCEDPAIVAARELVILMRENEKLGEELDAKEEALAAEIGQAWLACYGTGSSSDATMTLRFTDGVVRGGPSERTTASHRTTFRGLYARNTELDDEYPFNLPKIWLDRKGEIDMNQPINFVSTNDVTAGHMFFESPGGWQRWREAGGSSGSVVVNSELEVVGVVAGGNGELLHNDFVFHDDVARTVSVHVDGIMEALVKIYDAHHIAEELTGK